MKHAVPSADARQQAGQRRGAHVRRRRPTAAERERHGRHRGDQQDRRADAPGDVGPARQRRALHALEHAFVAQDRGADRHVHERRRDHAVGEDAGHEEVVVGDATAAAREARAAVELEAKITRNMIGKQEREEGARAVAPEGALLVANLPRGEPRSRAATPASRVARASSVRRSSQCPVRSWRLLACRRPRVEGCMPAKCSQLRPRGLLSAQRR